MANTSGFVKDSGSDSKVLLDGGGARDLGYFTLSVTSSNSSGVTTVTATNLLGTNSTVVLLVAGSHMSTSYDSNSKTVTIAYSGNSIATITNITNIGTTYDIVYATISTNLTLGFSSQLAKGVAKTILIENNGNSSITITIPNKTDSNNTIWYSLDGKSFVVPSEKFLEISVLCFNAYGTNNAKRDYMVSVKSLI